MNRNQSYQSWGNQQQNWQNRPSQESYRNSYNEYEPARFRGEYRFDERENYQRLNRENFGPDQRYSHPSGFRTERDSYRQRGQQDFYPNQNDYYRNRNNFGNYGNYNNYNPDTSYGASRNYGSMGSYGGAQGYGSSRNGYTADGWGSGHRGASFQPHHTVYGAYRDRNSFAEGEKESYDGSQRYGSQGADNTPRSSRQSRYQNYTGRSTNNQNDDRYEIYDTALSQYNRGAYGNPSGGSFSDSFNLRSHQDLETRHNYGSRQRSRNRQGSGSDQDYHSTSDLGYNSIGDSFSQQQPSYVSAPQNLYFDELSGEIRDANWERF